MRWTVMRIPARAFILSGVIVIGLSPVYGCGSTFEVKEKPNDNPGFGISEPHGLSDTGSSGPIQPNTAIVIGNVLSVEEISPSEEGIQTNRPIYRLELLVEEVKDIADTKNFIRDKAGKMISVYSKEYIPNKVINRDIKAKVSVVGDERGTRIWMWDIQVLESN